MDIELVAEDCGFRKGPIAMADGSVILTEIEGEVLTRVAPDGTKTTVAEVRRRSQRRGHRAGRGHLGDQQRRRVHLAQAERPDHPRRRRRRATPAAVSSASTSPPGKVETVYEACDGRRLVGPNDLVFDQQGGFWFTDHGSATTRAASSARSTTPGPTARRSAGPAII